MGTRQNQYSSRRDSVSSTEVCIVLLTIVWELLRALDSDIKKLRKMNRSIAYCTLQSEERWTAQNSFVYLHNGSFYKFTARTMQSRELWTNKLILNSPRSFFDTINIKLSSISLETINPPSSRSGILWERHQPFYELLSARSCTWFIKTAPATIVTRLFILLQIIHRPGELKLPPRRHFTPSSPPPPRPRSRGGPTRWRGRRRGESCRTK